MNTRRAACVLILVLIGVVLGTLTAGRAGGQMSMTSISGHPGDIVNIDTDEITGIPAGQLLIPAQSSVPIYQVPNNRWLIITTIQSYCPYPVQLVEEKAGVRRVLRGAFANGFWGDAFLTYTSSTGLCFSPGSTVAFYNPTNADVWVVSSLSAFLAP